MQQTGTAASVAGADLNTKVSGLDSRSSGTLAALATSLAAATFLRVSEVAFGEYAGTGAQVDVTGLPFDPVMVIIWNLTDGTMFAWAAVTASNPVATAKAMKIVAAAGPVATAAGGVVFGAAGQRKFSAVDAALVTNAKTFQYLALGV